MNAHICNKIIEEYRYCHAERSRSMNINDTSLDYAFD
jgi:hypothetical protein